MTKQEIEKLIIKLHDTVEQHLRESGTIQTDLAWLKRAFWTLAAVFIADVSAHLFKH